MKPLLSAAWWLLAIPALGACTTSGTQGAADGGGDGAAEHDASTAGDVADGGQADGDAIAEDGTAPHGTKCAAMGGSCIVGWGSSCAGQWAPRNLDDCNDGTELNLTCCIPDREAGTFACGPSDTCTGHYEVCAMRTGFVILADGGTSPPLPNGWTPVPGSDGGPSVAYACIGMPSDCTGSPTCACVTQHLTTQQCSEASGDVTVTLTP